MVRSLKQPDDFPNYHFWKRCFPSLIILLFLLYLAGPLSAVLAQGADKRPVNFIFLLDVSGSMLYKSEMVKSSDGSQVFLFEALRDALRQIVGDTRLIGDQSKISVITFGTVVEEKVNWPSSIHTPEERAHLVKLISSPEELQADKHGDTYMAGALKVACDKAAQMQSQSDPCATTFIIMLTDGWDEPPHGAQYKLSEVAKQLVARKKEISSKIGFDTWQVRVVGLQSLPDRKAGTTTARQCADMLNGQFIDVSAQQNGTVSERIFLALKQTVEDQRGQIEFPTALNPIEFGKTNSDGVCEARIPVRLDSCYAEDVTGVVDDGAGAKQGSSVLSADELTLSLPAGAVSLTPHQPGKNAAAGTAENIVVQAKIHSNCPAGKFSGSLKFVSSAKVARALPFSIIVPARIVSLPETIQVDIRKPGFLFAEPCDTNLKLQLKEAPGSHAHAQLTLNTSVVPPVLKDSSKDTQIIQPNNLGGGQSPHFDWDTNDKEMLEINLPVHIPANQRPGLYEGKIALQFEGLKELSAPSDIPFSIKVRPSAWEDVAPIAVPLFIIFLIVTALAIFLWVSNLKRER